MSIKLGALHGFSLVLTLVWCPWFARGQQGLQLSCQPDQLMLGCTGTYSVTVSPGTNLQITGVQWRWQQTSPCSSGWSAWSDSTSGSSKTYIESFVGDFTVQSQVSYQSLNYNTNPPTPQPGAQTLSINVSVPPPDDVILPNPASQVVQLGQVAAFNFSVTSLGKTICGASGNAKEDLTKQLFWPGTPAQQPLPDSLMTGVPSLLSFGGSVIVDKKGAAIQFTTPAEVNFWNSLGVGAPVETLKQKLYLILFDSLNNPHTYPLKTVFGVSITKAGANSVKVTVGP